MCAPPSDAPIRHCGCLRIVVRASSSLLMKPCIANSVFNSSSTDRSSRQSIGCLPCSLATSPTVRPFSDLFFSRWTSSINVSSQRNIRSWPCSPSGLVPGMTVGAASMSALRAARRPGSPNFIRRSSRVPTVASFQAGSWSNSPMVSRVNSNSIGIQILTAKTGASLLAFSVHSSCSRQVLGEVGS